jgi:hypothetical protein
MNCEQNRQRLESCFDDGEQPDAGLQDHLATCPGCAAYQRELEGLDGLLFQPAPVEADPAFVARIQAAVAQDRPLLIPMWARAAVALMVIGTSLIGGWVIDHYAGAAELTITAWLPSEPLMPDWTLLRMELEAVPGELRLDAANALTTINGFWEIVGGGLASMLQANHILLGVACLVGLAMMTALNAREARRVL